MTVRARIAYLWTPTCVTLLRVEADWPDVIARDGWIYSPDLAVDDSVIVRRGSLSGAEVVHYRMRRRIQCDDVPAVVEAYGITKEEIHGDRPRPRVTR